jgi:hypothetical protein
VFVNVVGLIVSWREYEVESAGDLSGMVSAIAEVAGRVLWVSCIQQPDCYGWENCLQPIGFRRRGDVLATRSGDIL